MTAALNAQVIRRLGVNGTARCERVVHGLDGLMEPVAAESIAEVGSRLWAACLDSLKKTAAEIDFILGLDSGGIVPTLCLAQAAGLPYKIAYKLRLDLPGAVRFVEPHAVRRDVYAYGIAPGQRILLVDDEITTGRTLANLARVLRRAGAEPVAAVCLVEDLRHDGRKVLDALDVPLVALTPLGHE